MKKKTIKRAHCGYAWTHHMQDIVRLSSFFMFFHLIEGKAKKKHYGTKVTYLFSLFKKPEERCHSAYIQCMRTYSQDVVQKSCNLTEHRCSNINMHFHMHQLTYIQCTGGLVLINIGIFSFVL